MRPKIFCHIHYLGMIFVLISLFLLTASCQKPPESKKPFSLQDLISIKNNSIEVIKEEEFLNAQNPLLSPDGKSLLFTTFEPDADTDEHSDSPDGEAEHASTTILYTINKKGRLKKLLEVGGHEELESFSWANNDSFGALVSEPIHKEYRYTYLPERKARLYSVSVTGKNKVLSKFTIKKDNSIRILDHGIILSLEEKTQAYKANDLLTGKELGDLSKSVNEAVACYPKDTDTAVLSVSVNKDSFLIKTTNKPLWHSEVFLHTINKETTKVAELKANNSHFNFIGWDKDGIYLQGFREGDQGMFYTFNRGVLTRKQFPKDLNGFSNYAGGKLAYETINYPDPDALKIVRFKP